jgi:creatinine amidohydrolase/Fe(II)-dependent formamide hydrolase-like protein
MRNARRITGRVSIGSFVAVLAVGALVAPARASGGNMEAILGGHLGGRRQAERVAAEANAKGFTTQIQEINPHDWEAEIFNGGTKSQADAVCARAHAAGFPHCLVERENHG